MDMHRFGICVCVVVAVCVLQELNYPAKSLEPGKGPFSSLHFRAFIGQSHDKSNLPA